MKKADISTRAPADLAERCTAPVDGASMVVFRVAFGLLMCLDMLGYLPGDRIQRVYTGPAVLFQYFGFSWVEPGSQGQMEALFTVLALLALAIALGLLYRLAAVLFFLGYTYVFLLDEATYNNHHYLICLLAFLLIWMPMHRLGSVDAAVRRGWGRPTLPAWCLWLLRFQIGVPYFFGGLAKLNYDWLVRAEPMALWLRNDYSSGPLGLPALQGKWFAYALTWGGTLFDLAIVPLMLWRRTRVAAVLAATAFHLTNSQLFVIGVFPWLMICANLLYFDPDWPRRLGLVRRRRQRKPKKGPPAVGAAGTDPRRRALVLAGLAVWIGAQCLLPFRHFLFPGWVDWTEEGGRFAWRMKLRHKEGEVHFVVVDKRTQQATVFKDFTGVLNRTQQRHLQHDPEMIRQFAHHLAEQLRSRGRMDVEVRAVTQISLNGRKPAPLVDPEADLAAEPRRLFGAPWIVPLDLEASLPD